MLCRQTGGSEPNWSVPRKEQRFQPMNETSAGQASNPEEPGRRASIDPSENTIKGARTTKSRARNPYTAGAVG